MRDTLWHVRITWPAVAAAAKQAIPQAPDVARAARPLARRVRSPSGVRSALLVVALAGCSAPPRLPPREPVVSAVATYTSVMVDLRSTLGRAMIRVDTQGADRELRTGSCDDPTAVRRPCAHCELAGATDAVDLVTLAAIKAAIDRYPTGVLDASKIQHVALCRALYQEPHRRLAGLADLRNHRMFVSLEDFLGRNYDPESVFSVGAIVHHELYHLLEYEVIHDIILDDVAWRAQNPAAFAYHERAEGETRSFGFVDAYASTNDWEDRASVFAMLMTRPEQLCTVANEDPIVRAKTTLIWERLAIAVGDDFLRRRASCVTWIVPATSSPASARYGPPPPGPWVYTLDRDEHWLSPPVLLRSLRPDAAGQRAR